MTYSLPSSGELPEAPSVLEKSRKQQSGEKDTGSPLETNIRGKQKRAQLPDCAAKHPLKGLLDEDNTTCEGIKRTKEVQKMPMTTWKMRTIWKMSKMSKKKFSPFYIQNTSFKAVTWDNRD